MGIRYPGKHIFIFFFLVLAGRNLESETANNTKVLPQHRFLKILELPFRKFSSYLLCVFKQKTVASVAYSQFKSVVGGVSKLLFFLTRSLRSQNKTHWDATVPSGVTHQRQQRMNTSELLAPQCSRCLKLCFVLSEAAGKYKPRQF